MSGLKDFLDKLSAQKVVVLAVVGILTALLGYFYKPLQLGAVGTGAFFLVMAVIYSSKNKK